MRKGEWLRPQDDLSLGRREEVPSGDRRGCEGRGERGRQRGGGVGKGVGGVDVGRKSGVWEVLGTGERMGLSVGPAALGATWEARVASLLV